MPLAALIVAVVLAAAVPTPAREVTVSVRAAGNPEGAVTLVLRSPGRETLRRAGKIGEEACLTLESGAWSMEVESDAWWSAPRMMVVTAPMQVGAVLWPAGQLRGRVKLAGANPPEQLTARFAAV